MNPNYPNLKNSIVMLILIVLIQLSFSIITEIIISLLNLKISSSYSIGLINLLTFGIFILRAKKKTGSTYKELFPIKRFNIKFLIPLIMTSVGLTIITSEIDNVFQSVLPMPEMFVKIMYDSMLGGSIVSSIYLLIIVAPITEELVFRGLMLRSFTKLYSIRKAILLSSLLFAIIHMNPWQMIGAFISGIVLSWWFVKMKTLLPCLIGHAVFNFMPILMVNILKMPIKGFSSSPLELQYQPLWFDLLGITLVSAGIVSAIFYFKRHNKNITDDASCYANEMAS